MFDTCKCLRLYILIFWSVTARNVWYILLVQTIVSVHFYFFFHWFHLTQRLVTCWFSKCFPAGPPIQMASWFPWQLDTVELQTVCKRAINAKMIIHTNVQNVQIFQCDRRYKWSTSKVPGPDVSVCPRFGCVVYIRLLSKTAVVKPRLVNRQVKNQKEF